MARVGSVSDDLMSLGEVDSDPFQRMGILAAFDSWERAKRFAHRKPLLSLATIDVSLFQFIRRATDALLADRFWHAVLAEWRKTNACSRKAIVVRESIDSFVNYPSK